MYRIFLFIIFLFFNSYSPAQSIVVKETTDNKIKNRIFTGGNFSLAFGSATYIDISPLVGYKVTEEWHVGTGVTYMYYKPNGYPFGYNVYGGRVFTSYYILENLFLHTEEEWLSVGTDYEESDKNRIDIFSTLVGGGYSQLVGSSSAFNLLIFFEAYATKSMTRLKKPIAKRRFET